jgi:putative DNA primase/helicase
MAKIQKKPKALTDLGNAERFSEQHSAVARYCPELKTWLINSKGRWNTDSGELINRLAHKTVRSIAEEAEQEGLCETDKVEIRVHAKESSSRTRIKAMLDIAKWFPAITVHANQLDVNPWWLNCQNGTLDLQTGELRPHNPEDLITKMVPAPYDPGALCPLWHSFISTVMGDDPEKVSFLQRVVGYVITGITQEHCMFVLHGPGANGKTTLIEVLRELLPGYTKHTTMESLLHSTSSRIRNDLARLQSTRLVSAVEVGMEKKLDEALIKQLTGGDMVTARFLYREYFEFKPQFKIFIAANHKPEIRGVDHGIWRRIHLIPFEVTIPPEKIDKDLLSKLKQELPGILAWSVRGCREWQEHGLMVPDSIAMATRSYRAEMDIVENFLEDKCIKGTEKKSTVGDTYLSYEKWCTAVCQETVGKKTFGNLLRQKGYSQIKNDKVRYWHGFELIGNE